MRHQKIPGFKDAPKPRAAAFETAATPRSFFWLAYSQNEKGFLRRLFEMSRDKGYNLALDNNGKPVPYNLCGGSDPADIAALRRFRKERPDAVVIRVDELKIVQYGDGSPANEGFWPSWDYDPDKMPFAFPSYAAA